MTRAEDRRQLRARRRRQRVTAVLVVCVLAVTAVGLLIALGGASHARTRLPARGSNLAGIDSQPVRAPAPLPSPTPIAGAADRAIDRALSYTSYIRRGIPRRRVIALSFDDGPGPWTARILAVLWRAHAPATFFETGRQVHQYPAVVGEEAHDGFVIGDHTETHPFLQLLAPAAQRTQIVLAADAIHRAGAPYPRLFRPPYGSFGAATLQILSARKMLMVLWTVDTRDYAQPGTAQIIYTALSGARPGAIILFHDGGGDRVQTAAALPRIIQRLRQRGYKLVTVPQLVASDPPPRGQPPPQPLSGLGS